MWAPDQVTVAEIPLGRPGAAEDYGPVVTFLASDATHLVHREGVVRQRRSAMTEPAGGAHVSPSAAAHGPPR
ncbi:hypothetical protein GCM10025331_32870 [Actinoplanes utahensis]|nr:hypothetical protein Aut01nite_48530 [Actinoplanes utahensis]